MKEDKNIFPVIYGCKTPDGFIEATRFEREYLLTVNRMQGATGTEKHLRLNHEEFDILMELLAELQKQHI